MRLKGASEEKQARRRRPGGILTTTKEEDVSLRQTAHLKACPRNRSPESVARQADPSCREEETGTACSDPEEHRATPNPLALPGAEGQGKPMRAFLGREKEDDATEGGVGGETGEEKETRGNTDDDQGGGGFAVADCTSEGLSKESQSRIRGAGGKGKTVQE
ncbi:hypothetical protein NDU88_004879 [Pleurodeles waltl]|uniref:Uncharacterized protein n=1 Tax=Pleurodeles waltl TaxID=8319 RepID=A0AAV7UHY7_PLEWA|nr:hypothetical protein NDU88_004879 [Pleurodeles waltl]